jgi:transcriptional regulator with XRE-family HTH domain
MRTSSVAPKVSISGIMERHGLTQRDVADGTGLALSAVNDLVNEKRQPTTGTVNKMLGFLRKYEPKLTYEDLFA